MTTIFTRLRDAYATAVDTLSGVRRIWLTAALEMLGLWFAPAAIAQRHADYPVNTSHIVYHDVRTDSEGGILPWFDDRPSVAYDHDLRLLWDFWRGMRTCGERIPYYLQHQVWNEKEDDQRGIGGDQIAMTIDSWNLLYQYLGDPKLLGNIREMADFWLEHGMSNPHSLYANLPYPYNLGGCTGEFNGDMRGGIGYLQPDKAGSFGAELVLLYKLTGEQRYLLGAVKIANTLVATVVGGDAEHSPWPFRVNAATGKAAVGTGGGKTVTASFTSNWTPTLRLFEGLAALNVGDVAGYRRTAKLVESWLKAYVLPRNKWGPFFEDIGTEKDTDTEINADTMAAYLLEHPGWGASAKADALRILQWTEDRLGNRSFAVLHVTPINEQTAYLVPGNSHTARHAWVRLLYCEKTGDCADRDEQVRRLNWATYSVSSDGQNRYPNDDIWLTDGYGDYVRHYLRSMAIMPELAPDDQNHLLETSSTIQKISYERHSISYHKFDARSEDRLKLGAGTPVRVYGARFRWDAATKVLTVHAVSRSVRIKLK